MITLTVAIARENLGKIVDEKPEGYIYPFANKGCLYVRDGYPDCLIGMLLARLRVPLELLHSREGMDAQGALQTLWDQDVLMTPEIEKSDLLRFLGDVQEIQDRGFTWREAVDVPGMWESA